MVVVCGKLQWVCKCKLFGGWFEDGGERVDGSLLMIVGGSFLMMVGGWVGNSFLIVVVDWMVSWLYSRWKLYSGW